MLKKWFFTILSFASLVSLLAQKKNDFGQLSATELRFSSYEKDTTAAAVVLSEIGNNYFEVIDQRIRLIKEYHVKIKIINEKGFDKGTIEIPFYHTDDRSEQVTDIRAITHNKSVKTGLMLDQIFETDLSLNWSAKRFVFPNIAVGSVLEYRYKIISPFIFNFNGWEFQSNIPKVYSEFNAKIPGNYRYNRSLKGYLTLTTNDSDIQKNCFYIDGYPKPAECEVLKYAMNDVPAFKEAEEYMLSPRNYIARLSFELSEFYGFDRTKQVFSKSWEDVEKEYKTDKDIGRQLTKKGFFEKNVPESLLTQGDALTRAKNIYKFVQNHFTWNEKYGIYNDVRVKEAFDEKIGNVGEINISLINLLNAAGIETNMMLLSTRNNGLPNELYPVISDFNYLIAKVKIDGEDYLLDATDNINPFGVLPFRCLNQKGRVMDFKNESYWYPIAAKKDTKQAIRIYLMFDVENSNLKGVLTIANRGYNAISKRKELINYDETNYLERMESTSTGNLIFTKHQILEDNLEDNLVSERFDIEITNKESAATIYFNPFIIKFFDKNPFTLENRNYPIEFGYARSYSYQFTITVPEDYTVQDIPQNKVIVLGDHFMNLKFQAQKNTNQVAISFDFSINKTYLAPENYESLKKMYQDIMSIQNNSLVVLKKKE